jgi:hypothetical protein
MAVWQGVDTVLKSEPQYLLLGRGPRCRKIGRTKAIDQLLGKKLHQTAAIRFSCVNDLHQCRPAPRLDPEEATAKSRPILASQTGRIPVVEPERARHGPVARFRCHVEHEGVRWIERDGAQELHRRGPPVAGSSHDGTASAGTNSRRPSGEFGF